MQDKCRIGIISTADIARKVSKAIQLSSNAEAYCVASRSLEKAKQWAEAHNIDVAYGSYDELLDDPNVDGVYIPLPTSLKKEWTIKVANKKKHVLVEKPLPGADSDQCVLEMIKACEQNGVQFLDGTMWIHSLRTKIVEQKKQQLGRVHKVLAALTCKAPNDEWLHGGNGCTDKNKEPQGLLGVQGWYTVGAILFSFDYENPISVQCLKYKVNKLDTIIEYTGYLEFSDQRYAYFDCGSLKLIKDFLILLVRMVGGFGRTGYFKAYFENYEGSDRFFVDDVQGKEEVIQVEPCNHTVKMIEQFASNILSNTIDPIWPQRSLQVHRIVAALFRATKNVGQRFKFDTNH